MTMVRLLVSGLALTASATVALAQADATGTGGGPLSTQTAPYTTTTGVTKPPSRDTSKGSQDDLDRLTRDEREQDKIDTGICVGCAPR